MRKTMQVGLLAILGLFSSTAFSSVDDSFVMSSPCFSKYKNTLGYAKSVKYCAGSDAALNLFLLNKHDSGLMLSDFIDGIMSQVSEKIRAQYTGRLIQFYDTGYTTYPTSDEAVWQVIRRVNWTYVRTPRLLGRKGFYIVYRVDLKNSTVKFSKKMNIND